MKKFHVFKRITRSYEKEVEAENKEHAQDVAENDRADWSVTEDEEGVYVTEIED